MDELIHKPAKDANAKVMDELVHKPVKEANAKVMEEIKHPSGGKTFVKKEIQKDAVIGDDSD